MENKKEKKDVLKVIKNTVKSIDQKLLSTVRDIDKKIQKYKEEAPKRRKEKIQKLKDEAEIEKEKLKLAKIKHQKRLFEESKRNKISEEPRIWF